MESRYPALLGVCNLILLVASTTLMYLGASLINFYLLDKFDFLSQWFSAVPYLIIGLGIASFIVAVYGFYVSVSDSRCNLIIYSVLVSALFVAQLVGIFAAMELRGDINEKAFSGANFLREVDNYKLYPSVREKWDALHREFGCCGAINFNDGYKIWRNADIGLQDNSVPDSCCLRRSAGCGRGVFSRQDEEIQRMIYTHGCVTVVEERFESQIVPLLLGYAAVSVVLALMEILAVVFACSYSAAIVRRSKESNDDMRSLRSGGYHVPTSGPPTPRFDHVRGQHFGQDNMTNIWVHEQDQGKAHPPPSITDMQERDV